MDKIFRIKFKIICVMVALMVIESMYIKDILNVFMNTMGKRLILAYIKKYGSQSLDQIVSKFLKIRHILCLNNKWRKYINNLFVISKFLKWLKLGS